MVADGARKGLRYGITMDYMEFRMWKAGIVILLAFLYGIYKGWRGF